MFFAGNPGKRCMEGQSVALMGSDRGVGDTLPEMPGTWLLAGCQYAYIERKLFCTV